MAGSRIRYAAYLGWIIPVSALIALRTFVPWDEQLKPVITWIGHSGWIGMVLATVLYVPLGLLLVPASALTVIIGLAHGFSAGFLCSTLGANLAAWAGFWLARKGKIHLADPGTNNAHLVQQIRGKASKNEFWMVFLARLSIFIPFGPLNYAFGLSRIHFREYALATFLGMLPGTGLYLWGGAALASPSPTNPAANLVVALGIISLGILLILVGKAAHQALMAKNPETSRDS